jgi:hypothetical protein
MPAAPQPAPVPTGPAPTHHPLVILAFPDEVTRESWLEHHEDSAQLGDWLYEQRQHLAGTTDEWLPATAAGDLQHLVITVHTHDDSHLMDTDGPPRLTSYPLPHSSRK